MSEPIWQARSLLQPPPLRGGSACQRVKQGVIMSNQPFNIHIGIAAPLIRDNIDTDQIILSREMKSVSKTGLSGGMFAGERYISGRELNPDFVLNKTEYLDATILLSGQNFGCGSSREHAVWALDDYGFRCVIASSFADIFFNNSFKSGLLPIALTADKMEKLFTQCLASEGY